MLIHQRTSSKAGWCLLNVVTDAVASGYMAGQLRMLQSLEKFHWEGGVLFYRNEYPPGSPTHAKQPYAFKLHALREAIRLGYERLLWLDSVAWFLHDPRPLLVHVETTGHLLLHGGDTAGQWCSDEVLQAEGLDREELLKVPLVGGSCYGLDLTRERTNAFWQQWNRWMDSGRFAGWAINDINAAAVRRGLGDRPTGPVSPDPRVMGHKHDETAASVIAHRLGMELTPVGTFFDGYRPGQSEENPKHVVVSQGY